MGGGGGEALRSDSESEGAAGTKDKTFLPLDSPSVKTQTVCVVRGGANLCGGRSSVKEGAETEWSALAKHPETWVEAVQLLFWVQRKYQITQAISAFYY